LRKCSIEDFFDQRSSSNKSLAGRKSAIGQ
jgi:hypothetical protein